jgi:predicted RNA methylase
VKKLKTHTQEMNEKAKPLPLEERIRDKGFTPSLRDAAALIELLASRDDSVIDGVERALPRLGAPLVPVLLARFPSATAPLRARILKLVAKLGNEEPEVRALLLAGLLDDDAKTRRNAAMALGKVQGEDVEDALLAAWNREDRVDHRRTLAASLGKMGSPRALEALRALDPNSVPDAELARIAGRSVLMLERTHGRETPSRVDPGASSKDHHRLVLRCRAGLEGMLAEELGKTFSPRVVGPGIVVAQLRGPLVSVFNARTMLSFGFELPQERLVAGESLADAVVRVLTSDSAWKIFRRFTDGPIRYRIAWASGGHRRAVVWECAERVAKARGELVNDPTRSTWEAVIYERRGALDVELRPRAIDDPRFTYRTGDVPAASHPTLAAAIARVAGVKDDDIVWDPFLGSGTELIERGALGRYAALFGCDTDPVAVETARKNLAAARVDAHIEVADATVYAPRGVTLILTNPPMGRRVVHHADLGALLQKFVEHAAKVLVRGGRMVWISPMGARTTKWATQAGLVQELAQDVDMGGFTAQIQKLVRPARRPRLQLDEDDD